MAKKAAKLNPLVVDRILLVGLLAAATGYILRDNWTAMFFNAAALVIGVIWSFRALTTNPSKEFRLLASLVLVLLGVLLAFTLGDARGLI